MSIDDTTAWLNEFMMKEIGCDPVRVERWIDLVEDALEGQRLVRGGTKKWELCADAKKATLIEVSGDVRTMRTRALLIALEEWAEHVDEEVKKWVTSLAQRKNSALYEAFRNELIRDVESPEGPPPKVTHHGAVSCARGDKALYASPASFIYATLEELDVICDALTVHVMTRDETMHQIGTDLVSLDDFVCALRYGGETRGRSIVVETTREYAFVRWDLSACGSPRSDGAPG